MSSAQALQKETAHALEEEEPVEQLEEELGKGNEWHTLGTLSHTHAHALTSPCCLLYSGVGEERITLQPKALKDQPVKELIQVGGWEEPR